jgi:hypothetical protein
VIFGVIPSKGSRRRSPRWPSTSLPSPTCSTRCARAGIWTSCGRPCSSCCRPLIDLEATQVIGAARYERTENRTTHRIGSRARLLSTKAGDVELAIPKLRHGSFFPSLLEPRRRIDRALWAVVMEAFVHGVSTRKVDDLVGGFGHRRRHVQEPGLPHLRRAGLGGGCLPGAAPGPHRAPVRVLRRRGWEPAGLRCGWTRDTSDAPLQQCRPGADVGAGESTRRLHALCHRAG